MAKSAASIHCPYCGNEVRVVSGLLAIHPARMPRQGPALRLPNCLGSAMQADAVGRLNDEHDRARERCKRPRR